jgi:hypothetical protein
MTALDAAMALRASRPDTPRPTSLSTFLAQSGFRPDAHDRADLEATGCTAPVWWRWKGYSCSDDAAEAAWLDGYIFERDCHELHEALARCLRGSPVYQVGDERLADEWAVYDAAAEDFAERYGMPHTAARARLEQAPNFTLVDDDATPADPMTSHLVGRVGLLAVASALGIST